MLISRLRLMTALRMLRLYVERGEGRGREEQEGRQRKEGGKRVEGRGREEGGKRVEGGPPVTTPGIVIISIYGT
jgi:hypothetical protein